MSFCHSVEKICLSVSLSKNSVIIIKISFCHSVEKNMSLCLSVENFCHYNKKLILSFCRKK